MMLVKDNNFRLYMMTYMCYFFLSEIMHIILYFVGLICISVSEVSFILANSANPDEMPCVAFHLGLHCLPLCNVIQR